MVVDFFVRSGSVSPRIGVPCSVAGIASRASMFDFNEPYTTVSFARPTMAASSSSVMSTALRKLVASLLLNCGGLP